MEFCKVIILFVICNFYKIAVADRQIDITRTVSYPNDKINLLSENDRLPKFIIDTDAGSDDAVALQLALAAKDEIQVIGIICTYGNTNESNVETNVLKILTIANRTEVPVYTGAQLPLLENYTQTDYFGQDGLGDFDFGRPVKGTIDRSKHAVLAMIELTRRYPGQINILTIGPLTNLALAVSLDPNFVHNVAGFYVMGGWFAKYPKTEFNFAQDPEANAIFFKALHGVNTTLTTILSKNSLVKNNIPMKWRVEVLGKLNSEVIQFLNKAERPVIERLSIWEYADAITVATAIWPSLVTLDLEARVDAITCHEVKGAVVADPTSLDKNALIIRDFDVSKFQQILLKYLA